MISVVKEIYFSKKTRKKKKLKIQRKQDFSPWSEGRLINEKSLKLFFEFFLMREADIF